MQGIQGTLLDTYFLTYLVNQKVTILLKQLLTDAILTNQTSTCSFSSHTYPYQCIQHTISYLCHRIPYNKNQEITTVIFFCIKLLQEDLGLFHYVESERENWTHGVTDSVVMEYLLKRLFDNALPPEEFSLPELENVLRVLNFPYETGESTIGDGNCFFRCINWSK